MGELVRKNLIVDAEALRALARERGTSESEAARHAIAESLAWYLMAGALEDLQRMGAFADTQHVEALYGPLPRSASQARPRRKRAASGDA